MVNPRSRKVPKEPLWTNVTAKGTAPPLTEKGARLMGWQRVPGAVLGTSAVLAPTCPTSWLPLCADQTVLGPRAAVQGLPVLFSLADSAFSLLKPGFSLGDNSPSSMTYILSRWLPVTINLFYWPSGHHHQSPLCDK